MATKIIKERIESQDLSSLATKTTTDNLQTQINSNNNDISALQNKLATMPNDMVRAYTGSISGNVNGGQVSYNLASLMGISDASKWKFFMFTSMSGIYKGSAGYRFNANSAWSVYVNSWTSGHLGYVSVAGQSGGYGRICKISSTSTCL